MTKPSNPAAQRPAPKTPVTKEAVQRVQRRTAATNGGEQGDWTRRLQSAADRRTAQTAPDAKPVGGNGGAASRHGGRGAGGKKSA